MLRIRLILIGTLSMVVALSVILAILPYPQVWDELPADQMGPLIAINFFIVAIQLSAAGLVLLGLKGYKTAFRHVYYRIAAGMSLVAFVTVLSILLSLLLPKGNDRAIEAATTVLYVGGIGIVYLGLLKLANIVKIQSRLHSLIYLMGGGVIAVIGLLVVNLPFNGQDGVLTYANQVLLVLIAVFSLAGANLASRVRHAVSEHYRPTMKSLFWSLSLRGVACIALLTQPLGMPAAAASGVSILASIGSIVFFMKAAYDLLKSTYQQEVHATSASLVDINVYLASLVSVQSNVDRLLDPMRGVTAESSLAGNQFSSQDKAVLETVCQNLKNYLVTAEPIRSFTLDELNEMLRIRFDYKG